MSALASELEARLHRAGLLPDGVEVAIDRLAGGYWNDVVRVRAGDVDWVVKRYAARGPSLFPIEPAAEARALDVLRGHRLAPEPVAFLPGHGRERPVLVYAYYPGRPWAGDVEAVADLQRRQHRLAPAGFRAVPREPTAIVAQGDALLDAATASPESARVRARRPGPASVPDGRLALLHTDAGPANLVDGPDGLRLIDWQCPALGDPAEDLFSFASPAFQLLSSRPPLDRDARRRYLDAYADPAVERRLDALWPALSYRMAAYCATRCADLAGADEVAAERYRQAVAACLDDL